ncbi:malectin domain-containing carbohydrate-binding protein [Bizionia myxarmorum]|uniref:malectin domain-containing carbohydrate-binding protein n=1 Tax=Bizionia myxarmorum TaxID=291186 RepID=UPI001B85D971|nr:malectin domain-containing carbohydrate-binding protein [Bizionia myxarmorum]
MFQFPHIYSQTISFGSTGLINEGVLNPTSLDFGPDDRLYVSQQNGLIWAYTIERDNATPGNGTYTVIDTEEISIIRTGIPNHNDLGIRNPSQQRLVTGILTAGTALNPILYVTSSDYLLGGGSAGNDSNLDTNSSMLSKIEKLNGVWVKTDLVRGLPRCEENHAINGLDMFEKEGITYLLIAQGGQTNKGAPSNNFAGTPEFFLSASILIVNLTQLEGMTVYTDPRNNTNYVYDLPTLNDPTRIDIDNSHPDFPYPVGHPMYTAIIDLGDPFGGNNSLNQAFPEVGGPLQVFSPGYRNAYDILVTENNRIYTSDNGPNALWGGKPKIYDTATDTFLGDGSTVTYDPALHYITNEMNESGSEFSEDPLHYIGTTADANETYYGGHPNPIRAFASRANVIAYKKISGSWSATDTYLVADLLVGTEGYFNESFSIADFPDKPEQGEYLVDEPLGSPKTNILDIKAESTNGIAEYTATNFGGVMKGNILTASFNGDINRYILNEEGDAVLEQEVPFNGFGSIPLDVIALGDESIFPGTVWAVTYGANSITVFEPSDLICLQPGDEGYDPLADNDGDGYTNQDEIDNGTNICSQSSKPKDNDGDFISDLNDPDDDNDGFLDVNDMFPLDANNGLTTNLPIDYPFWNNNPGTGLFGLGFTGLMLDPSGTTNYLDQFSTNEMSFGGAAGKATVDAVSVGDAFEALNDQDYGFQFGINVDTNSPPFTVHSKLESPYFGSGGIQNEPVDYQSFGIQIGTGDQDNYLKYVFMNGTANNDAVHGLQLILESEGIITLNTSYDIPDIINSGSVDVYVSIDPATSLAQPFYSIDGGETLNVLGPTILLPANFLDPLDTQGLAVGIISTSRSDTTANPFTATWDFINVYENQNGVVAIEPSNLDFGITPVNNSQRSKYILLNNEGGPTDDIISVTALNFTGIDAALFTSDVSLPFNINPGSSVKVPIDFISENIVGIKTASMEVVHSGGNSPVSMVLTGELTDIYTPLVRINAGGDLVLATDGGPNWEDNTSSTGDSYTVSSGSAYASTDVIYENRDASIPSYIDATTYYDVMHIQRSISDPAYPMIFSIALPNGDYIVNLYFANLYNGTSQPGERIFSINLEEERLIDNLDISAEFGHRRAGMVQNNISVTDGVLEIRFFENIQNPLINGIEILGIAYPELELQPIANRSSCTLELSDFQAEGSGGNPMDNLVYAISGQPLGTDIEPTNGLIFGTIDETALTGGPNNDGIYNVTVTLSKPGSLDVSTSFVWSVLEDTEAPEITCPENIVEILPMGIMDSILIISEPTATDNCSSTITFEAIRSDGLLLTEPYPLGETTITWTAMDASENSSIECVQSITLLEPILVSPKAYLQGASFNRNIGEDNLMRDDLRIAGLIPTTSPYSDGLICDAAVFTATGNDAIVDWIWIEIRDATTNTLLIDSKSGLIQRDGDVVDIDGISPINFEQLAGDYYLVINHRNHLGIMSASAIPLITTTTLVDFTDGSTATFGLEAQTDYAMPLGISGLYAGDVNNNAKTRYLGPSNDTGSLKNIIINASGNSSSSNYFPYPAYNSGDINMDGLVRYAGPNNDKSLLKTIILNHPDNVDSNYFLISEQTPN